MFPLPLTPTNMLIVLGVLIVFTLVLIRYGRTAWNVFLLIIASVVIFLVLMKQTEIIAVSHHLYHALVGK